MVSLLSKSTSNLHSLTFSLYQHRENKNDLFVKLQVLDIQLGDLYKDLDSSTTTKPDLTELRTKIRETIHQMDMSYGILGSLFRCGEYAKS